MINAFSEIYWIAAPAVVFAGFSKGGFGSGAAFASAAILATIIPPGQAIGIMLPLLMLMDVTSLRPYWAKWHWPSARVLMLGGIPGVALGAFLYSVVDADLFRILIGAISILFVLWQLLKSADLIAPSTVPLSDGAGFIAGAAAGFTSFVSHAGGPPAAIYLLSQKLNKTEFQATTVILFWAINIFKAIPYGFLGLFTLETLTFDLMLAPFAVLGVWLGVKAHNIVSEKLFFGITYVLLTITGLRLIYLGIF
jgi:uncharacterized membrane protein YfcA